MKFKMINLGYRSTPDYPYDYRIEISEYHIYDLIDIHNWLAEYEIPHTKTGKADVIYLRNADATLFKLKWSCHDSTRN